MLVDCAGRPSEQSHSSRQLTHSSRNWRIRREMGGIAKSGAVLFESNSVARSVGFGAIAAEQDARSHQPGGKFDAAQELCCLPLKCMDVPGRTLLVDLVEAGLGSGCIASVIASLGQLVRRGPGIL